MEQKTLLKNKKNQGNGGETMAKRDDSVKKKVPELRFKGFTDDWEQRKLEDISEIIDGDRGKNYPSGDDFKNNGHTLFLSAANVTKQGFL